MKNYKELIGKRVKIVKRKYKTRREFVGIIEWVEGCRIGLRQDNGELVSISKLQKRDYMMENWCE